MHVRYSQETHSGHGHAWITCEDNPRGYYMCWYIRDVVRTWRRQMTRYDAQELAERRAAGEASAADPERDWFYYQVSFVGRNSRPAGVVRGVGFGQPLPPDMAFPGWDRAVEQLTTLNANRAGEREWYLL